MRRLLRYEACAGPRRHLPSYALAQRLSGGEARDLVESLPEGLRARVDVCAGHRDERGEVFDRAEFLRRVADPGPAGHLPPAGAFLKPGG